MKDMLTLSSYDTHQRNAGTPGSQGSSSPRSLRRHSVIEEMVDDFDDDVFDGKTSKKENVYVKVFLKSVKGIKSSNSMSYFDTKKGMPLNTFRKDACIKIRRVRLHLFLLTEKNTRTTSHTHRIFCLNRNIFENVSRN